MNWDQRIFSLRITLPHTFGPTVILRFPLVPKPCLSLDVPSKQTNVMHASRAWGKRKFALHRTQFTRFADKSSAQWRLSLFLAFVTCGHRQKKFLWSSRLLNPQSSFLLVLARVLAFQGNKCWWNLVIRGWVLLVQTLKFERTYVLLSVTSHIDSQFEPSHVKVTIVLSLFMGSSKLSTVIIQGGNDSTFLKP